MTDVNSSTDKTIIFTTLLVFQLKDEQQFVMSLYNVHKQMLAIETNLYQDLSQSAHMTL